MELLITTSLIAAFVAGTAALFAPCCITVLLPAYMGSIFRQRRTVFLMTFIFFLGLLVVFLPLGLGFAALGQFFRAYHNLIFGIGAIFLLLMAASILLNAHFSLPFSNGRGRKVKHAGSVFVLGIFSGFATICCAPVLAGVLALSVLPGSIFWGGMYALVYVLGMVVPLFAIAACVEKTKIMERLGVFKKTLSYHLRGERITIRIADLISGGTFLAMGLLIFYLAQTEQLANHSSYQTTINIYLANFTNFLNQYLGQIAAIAGAVAVVTMSTLILKVRFAHRRQLSGGYHRW